MPAKLRVTLVKSPISHTRATRATVRALGLHRLGETVEVVDNPQVRGMVRAVRFLLKTDEIAVNGAASAPAAAKDTPDAPAAPRERKRASREVA